MVRLGTHVVLLASLVGLCGCGNKPKNTASAAPEVPAFKVKADDLMKEYGANAVAADMKYKGKLIQVTGKYESVQKVLLSYTLVLVPENPTEGSVSAIYCFMLEEASPEVAKLKQGDKLTIEGNCEGQALTQINLRKCLVVK